MPDSSIPTTYAADRGWGVQSAIELSRYKNLAHGWNFSRQRIGELKGLLSRSALPGPIRTLAIAGSLGRMDAAEASDCDLLVVLSDEAMDDAAAAGAAYDSVWEALKPLGLTKPKATGVFSKPTSQKQLCDKANVGAPDEDMRVFAKRLLLLLETQPVYCADEYERIVEAVVQNYAEGYVANDPRKEWGYLLNDHIRYFRSLCVNYQWDFSNEHGKWPIRNIKLRHSRLLMFAGLLILLGEASRERGDKVRWLLARLKMTPLERVASSYFANDDTSFFRVAGYYDTFLGMLGRGDVREELNGADPGSYDNRYDMTFYPALKANSDGLIAELLRFTLDRRGTWSERFFEYLIF